MAVCCWVTVTGCKVAPEVKMIGKLSKMDRGEELREFQCEDEDHSQTEMAIRAGRCQKSCCCCCGKSRSGTRAQVK